MKTRSDNFLFTDKLEWENAEPGIRRQIMGYDGQLMLVKVQFEKGAVASQHEHYHSQATYVVSGEFEVTIGDNTQVVRGGDGFYIEPDVRHGAVCREAGILIDTFTPHRETFLKK